MVCAVAAAVREGVAVAVAVVMSAKTTLRRDLHPFSSSRSLSGVSPYSVSAAGPFTCKDTFRTRCSGIDTPLARFGRSIEVAYDQ